MFRIGHGYDVHRLDSNRKLILGGVEIPHTAGLLGHSDADVLLHAVTDALLGAAAMGDIGGLSPDTDSRYKDADSLEFLRAAAKELARRGYSISNIDATVVAQRPRLSGYMPDMRKNIARACFIGEDRVSVKATTEEGLGFTGACEGIAAHAICIIY